MVQKTIDMNATILIVTEQSSEVSLTAGYWVGGIIALLILGYLVYTLIRPEKF
jgi:K+-transporting ATPase KdpF subunit